jgi:RNA polymerase sigma factor (TIGR02999 family)
MSDLNRILSQVESGDPSAAAQLLPLVYEELRKLAAANLARESPGHMLQATALVHEAYLRLVGDGEREPSWESRGHFFAAAAQSMRRILVEAARQKNRLKYGGGQVRRQLSDAEIAAPEPREDLVALDVALNKLAEVDREAAELVQLRYFTGLTMADAAAMLNIPRRSADRRWAFARAWLYRELHGPT